jgi:DNA polymerase-3 subunit delta'
MTAIMSVSINQAIIAELEKAHYHVERNANPKILFLDVSLQIMSFLKLKSSPQGNQYIEN